MRPRSVLPAGLALAGLCLTSACAAFFQSDIEAIRVSSFPASAAVLVNGRPRGSAPTVVWLAKRKKNQVIRLESPGYDPVEVRIVRHPVFDGFLLDAAFGVAASAIYEAAAFLQHDERSSTRAVSLPVCIGVPVLIDLASGKAHTLVPKSLSVTLTKASDPPQVRIVLVAAESLPDLGGITVRRD